MLASFQSVNFRLADANNLEENVGVLKDGFLSAFYHFLRLGGIFQSATSQRMYSHVCLSEA